MMSRWFRNGTIYLLILAVFFFLLFRLANRGERQQPIPINEIATQARDGLIESIQVEADEITLNVTYKAGGEAVSRKEFNSSLMKPYTRKNIRE